MPEFGGSTGAWDEGCGEVEEQLNLVSLALNAAGDAIIIHRPDGTLVRFNKAAADAMGMSPEEFEQLPPWGWATKMSDEARAERSAVLKEKGDLEFISPVTGADGRERLHEVHVRYVDVPGGPYIVAVTRDVTAQTRAREVLENLAFHDPLTGLANRALFEDRLEVALSSARRHNELLGVAYLDIDDFKRINDRHGHLMGDQVLIAVGQRLEGSVRQEDTVARLGGDEFAAIFPRVASLDDFELLAEKLVSCVSDPVVIGPVRLDVVASVGLAVFRPDDDARSLLMRADIEMYDAKRKSPTSRRATLRGPA